MCKRQLLITFMLKRMISRVLLTPLKVRWIRSAGIPPMPSHNKSLQPHQEQRTPPNRYAQCIRHGINYAGRNCKECEKQGTIIYEFVQPILSEPAESVGRVVSGRFGERTNQ